jgi:hypothetical protein
MAERRPPIERLALFSGNQTNSLFYSSIIYAWTPQIELLREEETWQKRGFKADTSVNGLFVRL